MNLERAAMQGRLAEAKNTRNKLRMRAEALCFAIRNLLNTALTDIDQIEIAQADQLMDDLMAVMAEIYNWGSVILRLEKDLR